MSAGVPLLKKKLRKVRKYSKIPLEKVYDKITPKTNKIRQHFDPIDTLVREKFQIFFKKWPS